MSGVFRMFFSGRRMLASSTPVASPDRIANRRRYAACGTQDRPQAACAQFRLHGDHPVAPARSCWVLTRRRRETPRSCRQRRRERLVAGRVRDGVVTSFLKIAASFAAGRPVDLAGRTPGGSPGGHDD